MGRMRRGTVEPWGSLVDWLYVWGYIAQRHHNNQQIFTIPPFHTFRTMSTIHHATSLGETAIFLLTFTPAYGIMSLRCDIALHRPSLAPPPVHQVEAVRLYSSGSSPSWPLSPGGYCVVFPVETTRFSEFVTP